jgi:hypothetical protein
LDGNVFRVVPRFLNRLSDRHVLKRDEFRPSNELVSQIYDENKWDVPVLVVSLLFKDIIEKYIQIARDKRRWVPVAFGKHGEPTGQQEDDARYQGEP